jgi:hypothetical protein
MLSDDPGRRFRAPPPPSPEQVQRVMETRLALLPASYTEEMRQRALRQIAEKREWEDPDYVFSEYIQCMFRSFMRRVYRRFGLESQEWEESVSAAEPERRWTRRREPRFGVRPDVTVSPVANAQVESVGSGKGRKRKSANQPEDEGSRSSSRARTRQKTQ